MKVVPKIIQSRSYLLVMTRQHICQLSVVLMLMMTSRKILKIREGMQVNIMFLNTNQTRLKYLPGANASRQISLVMKIIQKLAATINDILPIMLIVHSMLLLLSMQGNTSEAEYRIQLTSRIVSTCMIGIELNLHLSPNRVTSVIRKSMTATEHQALTSSTSKVTSEFLYIIQQQTNKIVIKYKSGLLRLSDAQPRQVGTQLTTQAYVPIRSKFQLQQLTLFYFLYEIRLKLSLVVFNTIYFQLADLRKRRYYGQRPMDQKLVLCLVHWLMEFWSIDDSTALFHLQFDIQAVLFFTGLHAELGVLLQVRTPFQDQCCLFFDFCFYRLGPEKVLGESFASACSGNATFDFTINPERIHRMLLREPDLRATDVQGSAFR